MGNVKDRPEVQTQNKFSIDHGRHRSDAADIGGNAATIDSLTKRTYFRILNSSIFPSTAAKYLQTKTIRFFFPVMYS